MIAAEDSFTADDGAEGAEEWWGTDLGGGEGSSAGSDLEFGDEADGDFWSGDDGDDGLQPDGRGRAVGSNTRGILAIKPMHKGDGLPPRPAQGTGRGEGGTRERYTRQHVLTQYNKDTNALIRRKVKGATRARGGGLGGEGVRGGGGGGGGILQIRIPPPPIPLSWGRNVLLYDPAVAMATRFSSISLKGPSSGISDGAADAAGGAATPRLTYGAASLTSPYGLAVASSRATLSAFVAATSATSAEPDGDAGQAAPRPKGASKASPTSSSYFKAASMVGFKFDQVLPAAAGGRAGPGGRRTTYQAVLVNSGREADAGPGGEAGEAWLER